MNSEGQMAASELVSVELPGAGKVGAAVRTVHGAMCRVIYAPGAGSNLDDPFGAFLADRLANAGIASVRFQFPYMEARKRAPDRPPVLEATWRAVIDRVRSPGERLVVGGRSMGGRIASQVVAQGDRVDALALFAYPLHQPGHPERPRKEHLPAIDVPTLFCSGTRDAFASPDELRNVARTMPNATVHLLADADHGFAVPRSTGRSREDVWAEATTALIDFLRSSALI
jgi:predicted alpha/beta-hydrolase family hydrolase